MRDVHVIFLITLGKQMNNNYAPCFNTIKFLVIHSYIELPCSEILHTIRRYQKRPLKIENIYNTIYASKTHIMICAQIKQETISER